jgi:hypothetical protein
MRKTFRDRLSFNTKLEHIAEYTFPKIAFYEESRHVIKKWTGKVVFLKISRPVFRECGVYRRDNCLFVIIQAFAQFNLYAGPGGFLSFHEDEVVLIADYCHLHALAFVEMLLARSR